MICQGVVRGTGQVSLNFYSPSLGPQILLLPITPSAHPTGKASASCREHCYPHPQLVYNSYAGLKFALDGPVGTLWGQPCRASWGGRGAYARYSYQDHAHSMASTRSGPYP